MDFMTDREFHPLFDRVSRRVNLRGCRSPAQINRRLNQRIKKVKREYGPRVVKREVSWLETCMHSGFGRRTINEAIVRPRGKVALTLRHGYKKANKILLERKRRKIGELRVVKPKEPKYKIKRR